MAEQKKILVPTKNAECWRALLADPEKHWKNGYSAKSAAESWENSNGIPHEIRLALDKSESFEKSELLIAIPEFKVPLPGGARPSQNDILGVLANSRYLSVFTIEAKSRENFDELVRDWFKNASPGKRERIEFLIHETEFPDSEYGHLRYQLFHRLASAVIMAKKFRAKNAIMIIQSFVENDKENHFSDFEEFVRGYGKIAPKNAPILLSMKGAQNIYCMWVNSKRNKKRKVAACCVVEIR